MESFEKPLTETSEAVNEARSKATEGLSSPLEVVSESLDGGKDDGEHKEILETMFGHYTFDEAQLKVIQEVASAIRGAAVASGAVAAIECITTIGKAVYGGNARDAVLVVGGVHVNNLTVIVDYGLTAVLLFMAAKTFRKVAKTDKNQLRHVFQGLLQLGFVFMQASTVTFALSVVQLMQAALRWPPVVAWVTGGAAALAVLRAVALLRMLRKFPPGSGRSLSLLLAMRGGYGKEMRREMPRADQWALKVVGGMVLPLTMAAEDEDIIGDQLHPDEQQDGDESRAEEAATGSVDGAGTAGKDIEQEEHGDSEGCSEGSSHNGANGGSGGVEAHEDQSLARAVKEETQHMKAEQQEEAKKIAQEGTGDDSHPYEFQPQEEQLLELVMNGMRVAGLALAAEALSSFVLGISTVVQAGNPGQVAWDLYNGLFRLADQGLRASLLFMAAGFFCRAITSAGHDIENLMAALGGKGLSRLFRQTTKVTQGVVTGLVIGWLMSAYNVAKDHGLVAVLKSQLGMG